MSSVDQYKATGELRRAERRVMSGFERVDAEEEQVLQALALDALEVLLSAGLPRSVEAGADISAGITVEVDSGDDEAGGVYLMWRPDGQLVNEAALAVLNGRLDDPAIGRSAVFKAAMKDAMLSILASSGFLVEESRDDLNPLAVRVLGRPD
jgi:hypothetical protein